MTERNIEQIILDFTRGNTQEAVVDIIRRVVNERIVPYLDSFREVGYVDYTTLLGTQYWYVTELGKSSFPK